MILLGHCIDTMAQDAFTNSGNLQVHTGATISGFGNLSNTSSGALTNNGSLYIAGNITNDQASMSPGTGTLFLTGTSTQLITGSQPFKTWHLTTSNSSGITLNNNLHVSGIHTFTNGIITTSASPNYLVYEPGASYTGDADSRHVNGWVKKIGSTDFVFPVGNGTVERTVAVSSLSAASEFNARYLANTPNPYQTQLPVRNADWIEYWAINQVSGGTATVTMNWDNSKVYFPNYILADLVAAGYNGSLWTDNGGLGTATGNAATTGSISSGTVSSFNLFTFGSISWILPLTITDFTATRQDHYTHIQWTTQREYNTDHFVVQRSDDASVFYPIDQVAARNSGNTEQYFSRDDQPVRPIAYYRLKTIDGDGKETFSRVVAVSDGDDGQLSLISNPVHDRIFLLATGRLSGEFTYQLMMINGQPVQQGTLSLHNSGKYEIPINRNILPGVYSIKITNHTQSFYFRILVL